MPNLPAMQDINLPDVTSDAIPIGPSIASSVVPGQPIEQVFGNILINMMESDQIIEDTSKNPESASIDALIAGMMATPTNPPQPASDTSAAALLSILTTTIAPNTGQLVTDKPATSSTEALVPATLINLPPDSSRQAPDSLHTASQAYTAALPVELSTGNMNVNNVFPAHTNSFSQAIDAANFADSGKSLPFPMTSSSATPVTAHTSSTPLIDNTADTPANNTSAIAAEFGQPDWPEEFSHKITWLATQRMQTAELKLHPAHLGPIEISLQLSDDQQLTAQFVSHHPAVREVIEANLPRLREIMAESGIMLADTSVSADTPRQQTENGQNSSFRHPTASDHSPYNPTDPQTPSLQGTRRSSLIDTFA